MSRPQSDQFQRCRRLGLVWAVVVALFASGVPAAGAVEGSLQVDLAKTGRLHVLVGVSGVPFAARGGERVIEAGTGVAVHGGAGVIRWLRHARIRVVRVNDAGVGAAYGVGDIDDVFSVRARPAAVPVPRHLRPRMLLNINSIFLDPNANPDDPSSYNFGPTDWLIAQIHAAGAQPLYRLGRSGGAQSDVPPVFERYARVAAHIVMHYNEGWDNGFHYGIKYWEVWNEPDFSGFWAGYPSQFYRFYGAVSKAVKAADPGVLVGGPAQARPLGIRPYGEEFLRYVRENHLPLDFYSWHWFSDSNDPYDLVRFAKIMRARLDKFGFRRVPSFVDEWDSSHAVGAMLGTDTPEHAAFLGAALVYLQQAPVALALYSLKAQDLVPHSTLEAKVLAAWGRMKDTPNILAISGTNTEGFAAIAGRSNDGRIVQVFVSNYAVPARLRKPSPPGQPWIWLPNAGRFPSLRRQAFPSEPPDGYKLTVRGLGEGRHRVKRFRMDAHHSFDPVDDETVAGSSIVLHSDLPPNGVELVRISNE